MQSPRAIEAIAKLIFDRWHTVGLQLSGQERQQLLNCIEINYMFNPVIISKINRHIEAFPPPPLEPQWLRMIDTSLTHLMQETDSLQARSNFAGSLINIFILLIPLVYVDKILNLQVYDDFFMQNIELGFLSPLAIPRSVTEAERMYKAILAMPMVYQYDTINGIQLIPQPFKAQLCFVMLFLQPTTPNSAIWMFQKACLEKCPSYLLDYPSITQHNFSSRPSFWMAYTIQDPLFRDLLVQRGSDQLRSDIKTAWAYNQKRLDAAQAVAATTTPLAQPLALRVSPAQAPLVALLESLDNYLAEHAPDIYQQLRPGVTDDQISKINAILAPLQLPEDLVTLYKWHNGTAGGVLLFNAPDFLPLEDALHHYREAIRILGEFAWCSAWFPIGWEHEHRLIPLTEHTTQYPMLLLKDYQSSLIEIEHPSISALIATYLEAYQTGAIYVDATTGWCQRDENRLAVIRQRHNHSSTSATDLMQQTYDTYESELWPIEWQPYRLGENL